MRFLKKKIQNSGPPDNTKLLFLLNNWSQNPIEKNYEFVMEELLYGNSFLLLPSVNEENDSTEWSVAKNHKPLKLTTVDYRDGVKTIWAFSDDDSLLRWSKKITAYTAMKSQDALKLCEQENIDRIVINIDSPNVFLAQRNK